MLSAKKRAIIVPGAMLCVMLICVCASALAQDVKYDYVPGTDFSKFKTYKWVEIPNAKHPDQMTDEKIVQAIDAQLAGKGFTKTDSEKADLYVAYQIAVDQEKQWNAYAMGRGVRFGGMGSATSSTINIGTLIFDVYDSANKKEIWRGDVTKAISPSNNPQKNQERLEKAMTKLLKNFPPPVKK